MTTTSVVAVIGPTCFGRRTPVNAIIGFSEVLTDRMSGS
jgi:hypothetical protein